MEVRTLESGNLGEYLLQIRTSRGELVKYIEPAAFAREVNHLFAEKVAQKLFEQFEPKIMELIKEK